MTTGIRRWTRCCKPNDLSNRLAAIRRHRTTNLGPVENDLLGQGRLREMVAVALFLVPSNSLVWLLCEIRREGDLDIEAEWNGSI